MKFKIKYASDDSYERIADINTIEELENLPERTQELSKSKGYAWKLSLGEKYQLMIEFDRGTYTSTANSAGFAPVPDFIPTIIIYDFYVE